MTTLLQITNKDWNFEKPNICGECGGKCCQNFPGFFYPEDLGAPDESEMERRLRELLDSGRYTLDDWVGDPRPGCDSSAFEEWDEWHDLKEKGLVFSQVYMPRPAMVGHEGQRYHGAFGGTPCTFLGEKGCQLEREDRPTECRALEPVDSTGNNCKMPPGMSKRDCAIAWVPYQNLFERLAEEDERDYYAADVP